MRRSPFLALLALVACAHAPASSTRTLDEAAARAGDQSAPARAVALAGFRAFLVENQPEKARTLDAEALRRDAKEPWALLLRLALARHDARPEAALEAALRLVQGAPRHPLAAVAAREVLDTAGVARSLDERILSEAPRALEAGATGDTALLLRLALVQLQGLRDSADTAGTRAAAGLPGTVTLLGPLSALHQLGFDAQTEVERTGAVPESAEGPFGPEAPRTLAALDGRVSLEAESAAGDVFAAVLDLDVPEAGTYVVRAAGATTHRLVLDGTRLLERRTLERPAPSLAERAVRLDAGKHRLVAVMLREGRNGGLGLVVARADGHPSNVRFAAARGPAPRWSGVSPVDVPGLYPDAASLQGALEPEAGRALATWIAAHDAAGRDADGARRLDSALGTLPVAAPWSVLSATLALRDRTLPSKVARGRATRDLEAAVERDPGHVDAFLARGLLAVEDQRVDQAADLAARARAAATTGNRPPGAPVLSLEARVAWAQGVDARTDALAKEALQQIPGLCEATVARYDVARRRDAVAAADALVEGLSTCPGEQLRRVEHWKSRGALDRALEEARRLRARDPGATALALEEAGLLTALRRPADAVGVLRAAVDAHPREPGLWKRLGDALATASRPADALAARERSLALDGSDLTLRRQIERARTGKELLAEFAIDGRAALKAFDARGATPEASSVLVVDAAATRAWPDGSTVDRIHTVEKVLDQSGVSRVAEVQLPSGAQVLALRTLKADGTVLEPESLDKETVSLPGVGVGDAVETEYLLAHPARRAASPGWTAGAFYFQVAGVPDDWATYAVVAPRGTGMTVDAHHMPAPAPAVEGDREVLRVEVRRAPALVPEPSAPPSGTEQLPFVVVGAGDTGQAGLLTSTADALLGRAQRSAEVEAFAREAAAGATGAEAVRRVHAAVMERIAGRDSGLGSSATATLAQERGSRLWLLKAALESLGIPARLAAVRTFATDPAEYRFPTDALFPYTCLRVEPPGGAPVWLDPVVRFGPFGLLPEQAANGQEAWLLPEPGRAIAKVKTPAQPAEAGRDVTLDLALAPDGSLSGDVAEVYRGFEAAQLAETLEGVSQEQRNQALQQALARYFGGAELSALKLDVKRAVGAPVTLRYHVVAKGFARVDEGRMTLGPLTYPAQVGRRYVTVGTRKSPLFVDGTERNVSHVRLRLPPGFRIDDPLPDAKLTSAFGAFTRAESQKDDLFRVEETYRLDMARIPVDRYEEFAGFAGQVDLLQTRDIVALKPAPKNPAGRADR